MAIETQSPTWIATVDWAKKEIETARDQLESPSLDEKATAIIRGRVKAIKDLLALAESKAPVETGTVRYT